MKTIMDDAELMWQDEGIRIHYNHEINTLIWEPTGHMTSEVFRESARQFVEVVQQMAKKYPDKEHKLMGYNEKLGAILEEDANWTGEYIKNGLAGLNVHRQAIYINEAGFAELTSDGYAETVQKEDKAKQEGIDIRIFPSYEEALAFIS